MDKYKLGGNLIYFLLKIILKTCRIKLVDKDGEVKEVKEGVIYGFWHNKLLGVASLAKCEKKAALASPSKDGELITEPLKKYGFEVVRGSSGRDGVKGLLKLVKLLKQGYLVGTPVDGPKGPIYKLKPGLLFLAQRSGKPFIPAGIAYSRAWCLRKTWDKFLIPKPFSKIVCYFEEPIYIGGKEDLDMLKDSIGEKITNADNMAKKSLENKGERDE